MPEPQHLQQARVRADVKRARPEAPAGAKPQDATQMVEAPESLRPEAVLAAQQTVGNQVVQRALDGKSRRKQAADSQGYLTDELNTAIQRKRGGGLPLPEAVQKEAKKALGRDFKDVRIHTDAEANRLSRSISARAFTIGKDIFFKDGVFAPGTSAGRETIIHELTHVIQQSAGGAGAASRKLKLGGTETAQEKQAHQMGKKHASAVSAAAGASVQRASEEDELQMQGAEEEELLQAQPAEEDELQMQGAEEEELLQAQPAEEDELQMQGEEEDLLQAQPAEEDELQMQGAEEEELLQAQPAEEDELQMQGDDDDWETDPEPSKPSKPAPVSREKFSELSGQLVAQMKAGEISHGLARPSIPKAPPPPLPKRPGSTSKGGFSSEIAQKARSMSGAKQRRNLEKLESARSEKVGKRVSEQFMQDKANKPKTFGAKAKSFAGSVARFGLGKLKDYGKSRLTSTVGHFLGKSAGETVGGLLSGKKEEKEEKSSGGASEMIAELYQENKKLKAQIAELEKAKV